MANSPYSIELGVHLKTSEIRTQISAYNKNSNNAKLHLGVKIDTADLQKQLKSINGGKGLLSLNTATLEASLDRVAADIKEIRNAFGTIDSKSNMNNLLASINQISVALDNASKQFVELNTQLNSLSGKNFGVNIGLNMGGSAVAQQSAYGDLARSTIIPQLKQQVSNIVQQYNAAYKTVENEQQALINLVSKTKLATPSFFNDIMDKNGLFTRMGDSTNLKQQIAAYREYISLFEKAASFKNPQLAASISGASQEADQLATRAAKARAGVTQLDDSLQKLKGVFGSGVDAEKLSAQLDDIVADLGEIKTALQGLSKNASLDNLTASFNNLSASLEKLVGNATRAKNALDSGFGSSVTDTGTGKAIQDQNKLTQAITQTTEAKKAFVQTTSVGKLDALNLKDGITEADRFSAALSKLKNIQSNLGRIEIGKINTSNGVQQLQLLENQLESLSAEWNETVTKINGMGGVSATQLTQFQNQADTTKLKLDQLSKKIIETKAQLASKIQGNFGNYEAQIVSLEGEFSRLATKPQEIDAGLKMLKQALTTLKTADSTDAIIAANDRYLAILKQVNAQINLNANAERNSNDAVALQQQKQALALKMSNWLRNNSAAAKEFGRDIQNLQVQLKNCGNMSGVRQVGKDFDIVTAKAKEAGLTALSFGDRLKKQFAQYSSYFSVYSLFMYGTMAMRSMFEQVKSIDSAMTELKKVTNETADSYNRFLTNAADKSKEIGTTIDGLVSSTADFARLGYGFEDAQGLAEVANIYAVVGDEIDGVEQATESLISTMAAFKDEMNGMSNTDFAMSIIDKFNEIGNNFAISSGGIGEALERSASSLMAANNTIDESIALITAANTVVQDPTAVGKDYADIKSGYIG